MSEEGHLSHVRDRLNAVSPSYCVAKWRQVTIHLESGTTHSCHHPNAHAIPLEEVKSRPDALHNTQYKMLQRSHMLNGIRPKECGYCWAVEDLGPQYFSDRTMKSSEHWALPSLENLAGSPWNQPVDPSYMEVSFSRVCNLKCSYCSAQFSTRWQNEIDEFGPYPTGHGKPTHVEIAEEDNPYIAAFWKWWPTVKKSLKVFRITGGEPLLSPNTFRVFESLIAEGESELEVAVNSNLMAPPAVMEKFLAILPRIEARVGKFRLFTSLDGWGAQAEYIRHGLKLPEMYGNVEKYLSAGRSPLTFMVTLNALSLFSIQEFFQQLMELRRRFPGDRLLADISYLQNPAHQSLKILPMEFWRQGDGILSWMKINRKSESLPHGLLNHEIVKFERALKWMKEPSADRALQEGNFHTFFAEHDRRRGTDFCKTFPELAKYFVKWGARSRQSNSYQLYMGAKRGYQSAWKMWAKYRGLMRL